MFIKLNFNHAVKNNLKNELNTSDVANRINQSLSTMLNASIVKKFNKVGRWKSINGIKKTVKFQSNI